MGSINLLTLPQQPIQKPRKNQSNSHNDNDCSTDNSSSDISSAALLSVII